MLVYQRVVDYNNYGGGWMTEISQHKYAQVKLGIKNSHGATCIWSHHGLFWLETKFKVFPKRGDVVNCPQKKGTQNNRKSAHSASYQKIPWHPVVVFKKGPGVTQKRKG